MHKRIGRLTAGLALAAAAVTGTALAHDIVAAPADTTWGAPDTTDTTTSVQATDGTSLDAGLVVTPLDTYWG